MKIAINKESEVPLRQQLAEQIVFLITSGNLRYGEQMPSVRTLARVLKIHHNTVSEAYQDLVHRGWLSRERGSRLTVGMSEAPGDGPSTLDELINETIERAKTLGYSAEMLTDRVRQRLLVEPADCLLVIEEEPELRCIMQAEIAGRFKCELKAMSPQEFLAKPLMSGAQIVAPRHVIAEVKAAIPIDRPAIPMIYSHGESYGNLVRALKKPSVVAAVSISEGLLRTAEGFLAPAIGRKHSYRGFLLKDTETVDLKGVDLALCDSIAFARVKCRKKIHYGLVAEECMEEIGKAIKRAKTDPSSATNRPRSG